jgi:ABC-2 type transport system permease protein
MRLWTVAWAVAWRILKLVATSPSILIPSLIFPLFFFTAFAGGLSQVAQIPGFDYEPGYTTFQFAFVLIQSAAFGGVFTGFRIAQDFERGIGRRLLLAAPNRKGIVLGYAIAAAVRWVFTAAVLTVVALVVGMNVFGGPLDVFGMYALAFLINVAGLLWAAGVAMRFRTMQAGPVMQMPVFLTLFFAPVYVPLTLLSGWIETVATLNPLTYVLEAVRSLLAGDAVHVALAFLIALALVTGFTAWSLRGLSKAEAAG